MQHVVTVAVLLLALVASGCSREQVAPADEPTPAAAPGAVDQSAGGSDGLADEGFEAGEAESLEPADGQAAEDGS